MRLEHFKPEHLDTMNGSVEGFDSETATSWAAVNALGPSWTILEGDKAVFCGGVNVLWPGVGEAWSVFAKDAGPHVMEIVKTVMKLTASIVADQGLHRLQAHARADIPQAGKFLELIGFEREGLLRKYGRDGSDHFVYSMVR